MPALASALHLLVNTCSWLTVGTQARALPAEYTGAAWVLPRFWMCSSPRGKVPSGGSQGLSRSVWQAQLPSAGAWWPVSPKRRSLLPNHVKCTWSVLTADVDLSLCVVFFVLCREQRCWQHEGFSGAFHEKHPPPAAGKSLQHGRERFSACHMPSKITKTSFQSKLGILSEKPGGGRFREQMWRRTQSPPRSEAAIRNDLPPANPRSQLTVGHMMAAGCSQLCPCPACTAPSPGLIHLCVCIGIK